MADKTPSSGANRSFGFLLTGVCAFIALMAYWRSGAGYTVWAVLAMVLAIISLTMARVLAPLRRAWMRLGGMLSHVVNPLMLGAIYAIVIVPVGAMMRLVGRDPLGLRRDPARASYWEARGDGALDAARLKDQF